MEIVTNSGGYATSCRGRPRRRPRRPPHPSTQSVVGSPPPADAFFDTVIDLPALTPETATALLTTRLSPDPGVLPAEIAGLAGREPAAADRRRPRPRGPPDSAAPAATGRHRATGSKDPCAGPIRIHARRRIGGPGRCQRVRSRPLNRLGWTRARIAQPPRARERRRRRRRRHPVTISCPTTGSAIGTL